MRFAIMSKTEFERLTQDEQLHLLQSSGIYIGKLRKETLTAVLYQLETFYVEVLYRQYRRLIKELRCFESASHIDPYLEQTDLGL